MRGQIREATVTLRHIQTIHKNGHVYRYLRIPGQPRIKLPDLQPDDPAFLAAYAQAMQSAPRQIRAAAGSIAAIIEGYLRSDACAALSDGYRKIIRRHMDSIRTDAEGALMRHLRADHIQDDLRPLTAVQQRDRMKAWRLICGHALEARVIASDPTEGVRRPKPLQHVSHPAWTLDHIEAYRARWPIGTVQRAVMEVTYWTGARISDAVMIGPGHVGRDGVLTFRQQKTGDLAYVPWVNQLPAHAEHMAADRAMMHEAIMPFRGHMTFLATRNGKTRSHKAAGHLIAAAAEAAGFDRSAHGLRRARAVHLAEAGANTLQIGAWTGHHSLSEIAHYVEEQDRRRQVMAVNPQNPAVNRAATD